MAGKNHFFIDENLKQTFMKNPFNRKKVFSSSKNHELNFQLI